jgi:hypothetical protein
MELLGFDLPVPDYSTLSRRMKKLEVKLGKLKSKGKRIHVVLDSTGLKVFGEGEWKVRQHGYSKRRTWMKLHLAVDEADGEILSMSLTENSFKDNELFEDLLKGLEDKISDVSADGAYDDQKIWDFCEEKKINPLIPPKKNAVLKQHGNSKSPPLKTKPALSRYQACDPRAGELLKGDFEMAFRGSNKYKPCQCSQGQWRSTAGPLLHPHRLGLKCRASVEGEGPFCRTKRSCHTVARRSFCLAHPERLSGRPETQMRNRW